MNDRYDQDILRAYLEGDLPDAQRAAFERQLQEDPRLRELLEQLAADRQALRNLPQASAPPGLLEQALQQHERQMLLGDPDKQAGVTVAGRQRDMRGYRLRQWLAYGSLAAGIGIAATAVILTLVDSPLHDSARNVAQRFEAELADTDAARESAPADDPEPAVAFNGRAADDARVAQPEAAVAEPADDASAPDTLADDALWDPFDPAGRSLALDDAPHAMRQMHRDGWTEIEPFAGDTFQDIAAQADALIDVSMPPEPALTIEVYTDSSAAIEHRVLSWAAQHQYRVTLAPVPIDLALGEAQHIAPELAHPVAQVREVVIATDGQHQPIAALLSELHQAAEHHVAVADRPQQDLARYQPHLDAQRARQLLEAQEPLGSDGVAGGGGRIAPDTLAGESAEPETESMLALGARRSAPPEADAPDAEAEPAMPRASANLPSEFAIGPAQAEQPVQAQPESQALTLDAPASDIIFEPWAHPLDWRTRLVPPQPWMLAPGESEPAQADALSLPGQGTRTAGETIRVRVRIFERAP